MLSYEKLIEGIFLVKSDFQFTWKCDGILIKNVANSGNILIDCNFKKRELIHLLKKLDNKIEAYFATHVHLDHTNFIHHLEKLKPDVKIYCPIPEHEYLLDIDKFIEANGAIDYGVAELIKEMFYGFMGFKELKSVIGFNPTKEFNFGGIRMQSIHLPGHSPGNIAFIIENTVEKQRKILFAGDIGLETFGAWYGFKYNSLKQIRADVMRLEELYLNDDFILVTSHGTKLFENEPEIFKKILDKIDRNEQKVLNAFDTKNPRGLEDITLQGIIYKKETISRLSAMYKDAKKLWFFWEAGFLQNHIDELVEQGKLIEVESKKWILKKS